MFSRHDIKDVVIIGGGPIGIFSIFTCGMQNLSCVLIDAQNQLGGQCSSIYPEKNIYDIPGFKSITAQDLVNKLIEQANVFKPQIELNSFVENISFDEQKFTIYTKNNDKSQEIYAKSIIIALGAGIFQPAKPSVANIDTLENKSIFYSINNLEKFDKKKIAIIGGGDSALDWTLTLFAKAEKIFLIHRRERISGHQYSWQKVQAFTETNKISIKIPYILNELKIENNELKSIIIENVANSTTEELLIDYLLPCLGTKSNTDFLNKWNLILSHNKILVDPSTQETSRKLIYAIGDCVKYKNRPNLIATGFSEAFICARAIYAQLNPDAAPIVGHSTNIGLPKN